jgi:tetratricopeptide (TPR) repeat protein
VSIGVATWALLEPGVPPVASVPAKMVAAQGVREPATPPPTVPGPASPETEFAAKIEDLHRAGNWHVLVLHATYWTRKEPTNAAAWAALGVGYAKLGQIEDSLEAAKQTVALDGANAAHLRRLADAYVVLDRPADALVLVEKMLALDDRDLDALALAGTLLLQLGKLAGARDAFDRAADPRPRGRLRRRRGRAPPGRTKDVDLRQGAARFRLRSAP